MSDYTVSIVESWFGPIRVVRDPDLAAMRPTRKVRGRRRYYRALERDADQFAVVPAGFYDYMHWHVDWSGLGNLSWRERSEHLAALFAMFRRLEASVAGWRVAHQIWLQIDAADSSQDAVYLHTQNPNGETFPNEFRGVDWDVQVPERLAPFLTDADWQFGRRDDRWTHFIVRPRPSR